MEHLRSAIEWQHQEQIHVEWIRDEVQEQAAKDAAHRVIAMCLPSSRMLLNWLKIGIPLIKNEESLEFFRGYFYGKNNTIF
jgi:hypothetical protein